MQKMYEALCSEVTHLHAGLKHQAGLIQKLRPLLNDTKQGKVQTRTPTHTQKTLSKIFFFFKVTKIFNESWKSVDYFSLTIYSMQYANIKYDGWNFNSVL